MGEVNDTILEWINEFWKGLNIDEEQLVITTDQMTLICMFQNIETKNPWQIKQYIYIMFVPKI